MSLKAASARQLSNAAMSSQNAPATGTPYINTTNQLQLVLVTGGTVTVATYTRGGFNVAILLGAPIILGPGDQLTLVYVIGQPVLNIATLF